MCLLQLVIYPELLGSCTLSSAHDEMLQRPALLQSSHSEGELTLQNSTVFPELTLFEEEEPLLMIWN